MKHFNHTHRLFWTLLFIGASAACTRKEKTSPETIPQVSVAEPIVRPVVLHKEYPGYLASEQSVSLVARVNGYVEKISFAPGAFVKKGTLLFVIEPTLYNDQVIQAEAAVNKAKAALDYSENSYARMKEAALSDAISQIDLIQAESNVKQAKAALNTANAQLETARTNLSYCYIRAPFDGHISKSAVDLHGYVNGAAQAVVLATIYKDERMYAYFNIEDNQYLKMQYSDPEKKPIVPRTATILFQEKMRRPYQGKLDYVSPNIELSTGTLNLRAEIENPEGELKSGLYVTVRLPYGEKENAVLIQDASIGTDQLGKYVYLVDDSNRVVYTPVKIGQAVDDTLRLIESGIPPGSRYVTKALLKVRNGLQVDPIEESTNR